MSLPEHVSESACDNWLSDGGPAAIILREQLEPVEGPDSVYFPATYAAAEDKSEFAGGYNIDVFPSDEALANSKPKESRDARWRPRIEQFPSSPNICLVDSVGSQANRIEPAFSREPFGELVPQILIKVGSRTINLLDAGHRAGDAVIRFTTVGEQLWKAFQSLRDEGNAEALAKIAPTSLVFGVWDSRGTQVKVARAFRSTVRAHNVRMLTRSAQFNRAARFVEDGPINESLDTGDGEKNALSREGLKDSPATATHGGVCGGEIWREVTINLAAIRRLRGCPNGGDEATLKLRRYILGLALVSGTLIDDGLFDLREGCHLRPKPGGAAAWTLVNYRGPDQTLDSLDSDFALSYAKEAAAAFVVGPSHETTFEKDIAESWLKLDKKDQDKRRRLGPVTLNQGASELADENTPSSGRGRGAKPKGNSR